MNETGTPQIDPVSLRAEAKPGLAAIKSIIDRVAKLGTPEETRAGVIAAYLMSSGADEKAVISELTTAGLADKVGGYMATLRRRAAAEFTPKSTISAADKEDVLTRRARTYVDSRRRLGATYAEIKQELITFNLATPDSAILEEVDRDAVLAKRAENMVAGLEGRVPNFQIRQMLIDADLAQYVPVLTQRLLDAASSERSTPVKQQTPPTTDA